MITQHVTLSGPGNYFISKNFRDFQKNVSINICRRLSIYIYIYTRTVYATYSLLDDEGKIWQYQRAANCDEVLIEE